MKKNLVLILMVVSTVVFAQKKQQLPDIKSSINRVEVWFNGGYNDWTFENESSTWNMFSVTKKYVDVKIKTDLDSVEFKSKKNQLTAINIIHGNDTLKYSVNLTDKFENTLSDAKKLYLLGYFWSEAKYNFAFFDKLKFNWDSLYTAYIPKVINTKNDFEFYRQMELFACSLKDLHTGSYYENESDYTKFIPMTAKYFGNDLYIVSSYSKADLPPVKSKILKINDLPIEEYIQKEVVPFINSDFEPIVKSMSASKLFSSDLVTKKMKITYQTPDNQILTKTLSRYEGGDIGERIGYTPKYSLKPIEIEWQKDNIALLKFNTFNSLYEELIPMFDKMKDTLYSAKGIIIDLRNNRGGGTDVALHLLQHIIKDKYFLTYAYQTRINDGVKRATGNFIEENADFLNNKAFQTFLPDTIYIPDSIKQFTCPVVVLSSNNTCSAAEDFLIMLKERPDRPLFIGQPTMGSTGSPLVLWDFPANAWARICTRRVLYPYSLKPYTEGIYPDIQVDYTIDEFMSQEVDKEVEIAIKELKKMIK